MILSYISEVKECRKLSNLFKTKVLLVERLYVIHVFADKIHKWIR